MNPAGDDGPRTGPAAACAAEPTRAARTRGLAGLLAAAALATLAGCGTLGLPGGNPLAPPAPPPAVRLEVVAPAPLRDLLAQNLDIARLGALAGGERLSESELARLVAAAPDQARELLETEGYFRADVQAEVVPAPAGPDGTLAGVPSVRLRVVPGEQAVIGRVDIQVVGALEQQREDGDAAARALVDRLRADWALATGQPFRNATWSGSKSALLTQLRAAGYPTAAINGSTARVDVADGRVRLFVVADSGPLFRVGELRIEGLERQDETTIRRLAGFGPGAPATETLLLDFQERLQLAGLYDRVTVVLDPDPDTADAAPVIVRVRELSLQQATIALGVDSETGPRVTFEHTHRRVFGWRATAFNKIEWGRNREAWDGDITTHAEPGFYRNVAGVRLERLLSENDTVVSQRIRAGRAQDTIRIDSLTFVELERSTRNTFEDSPEGATSERRSAVSLNRHVIWRRLDNLILPTDGLSASLETGIGQATGTDGRTGPFGRVKGRVTAYHPLGGSWFAKGRLELGEVFSRSDVAVPDSQRFRAGGDDSVRGYGYRTLAPTVDGVVGSGRVLFTASAEVQRPILPRMPSLWGAAFIDAGRAADDWGALDPAVGVGFGVRWRSPVGPLRFDIAYGEELRAWRTHLSVGITY